MEIAIKELSLPPVSTFEDACARCHGPQGSFYGQEFANLSDEELTDVTREMMEGPAFLQPSNADVQAMVAYHRALAAREPFLVVTGYEPPSAGAPGSIRGEATPEATVGVGPHETRAGETGKWEIAELSSATPTILARKQGETTSLNLSESQWSHAQAR